MTPKLLLYCTKAKPYLFKTPQCAEEVCKYYLYPNNQYLENESLNGKIVGECDYEIEEIYSCPNYEDNEIFYLTTNCSYFNLLNESCLNETQLEDYLKGKKGYAIHIKNLKIYDKPRELSDYAYIVDKEHATLITKAPQNMCYAYEFYDCFLKRNILISIHPEWLCKILNGEKTIECRKRILKGMITK